MSVPQPQQPSLERPDAAKVSEAIVGAPYVELLGPLLARLRQTYQHPNRVLHFDTVLTALLIGFYNSTLRSLRTIEDQSQADKLASRLD
jgi:hypothetical protein